MIPAIVPCIVGKLGCEVVLEEESLRMVVLCVDADLACFTGLADVAVGIKDLNVVERIRFAHGTELDLRTNEVSDNESCLRLAEAFHKSDSGSFHELVENLRVQSFAGCNGILE